MKIHVDKKMDASEDEIWNLVRDVDAMPKYWHGTRKLIVINKDGNTVHAKVQFAFPGPFNKGEVMINIDDDNKEVIINYVKGPFTGTHRIKVNQGEVISDWDVNYKFPFSLLESWNENHFKEGTIHALERIEQEFKNRKTMEKAN